PPLVEPRCGDPGAEGGVLAQPEAVGDVLQVALDLLLAGVPLRPVPVLLQLLVEGVGVVQALEVAARTRVAVPVPGAADRVAGLVQVRGQPRRPGAVQHVEAGETGARDHDVVRLVRAHLGRPHFSKWRRTKAPHWSTTSRPSLRAK